MKKINRSCYEIISFLNARNGSMYAFEALDRMKKQALENQKEVEKYLEKNKLQNCINSDNYYLLLYCVVFKEELITSDILNIIINNCDNKILPFLHILMMNSKLSDEIVLKIIKKIEEIDSDRKNSVSLGYLPFDYRYHILKREEISDELKEKILSTYDDIEYIKQEIYIDLDNELGENGINLDVWDVPDEIISKYPELKDQKRALESIHNYQNQKRKIYE